MNSKTYNRVGYICMTILIILLLPLFVPRIMGYETFSVISGSMEPAIPMGSLVYVREVDIDDIKKNDVITFYGNHGSIVTHRIQQIERDGIVTKGDANKDVDLRKVSEKQVIGKVFFSFPLLGYLTQSVLFYFLAIVLLGTALGCWWKTSRIERKSDLDK